jgi:carbon monoxide dehydrogenase subunit G
VAIEIRETFKVSAPIDEVWKFVLDPGKVAACMPGASLEQVVDERTYLGSIKVKVGAVMASYKGRVEMTHIDAATYTVQMLAEGRETGGGTAKGTMTSRLTQLSNGGTEVVAEASVDLTGRIMQVGRGMIQGVSAQLFQQFVTRARASLETSAAAAGAAATGAGPIDGAAPAHAPGTAAEDDAIRVLPLLLRAAWMAIVAFFRRLFGRADTTK